MPVNVRDELLVWAITDETTSSHPLRRELRNRFYWWLGASSRIGGITLQAGPDFKKRPLRALACSHRPARSLPSSNPRAQTQVTDLRNMEAKFPSPPAC